MEDIIEIEKNLVLNEYNADYEEEFPAELTIYLSITPVIHYQFQINFKNYPEKPDIVLSSDLRDEVGDPARFLTRLREWNPTNPPHIVDIIHELEEFLQRIIYPNDEMEQVMMEYPDAHMIGPFRLFVQLYSYNMQIYDFQIVHQKGNPPKLILSAELEKIIKINELRSLQLWPRIDLIDICRELSKKIDHRTRILAELKQLDEKSKYQKIVKKWDAQGLVLEVKIEIETGESCTIEINLTADFPLAPPNFELKSLSTDSIRNELNELLLSHYNQWEHATNLVEILDDFRNFLKRKSKNICQNCHHFKCPKCRKPISSQLSMSGISGENQCMHRCHSCNSIFHYCCWTEQIKMTRKCPVCLAQQSVFL